MIPEQIMITPSDPNSILGLISARAGVLSSWVYALKLQALYSQASLTVFIPSQKALDALGPNKLRTYAFTENAGPTGQILRYWVVRGRALARDLKNGQTLTTAQGQSLTVSITNGQVFINGLLVSTADVAATNGVIHVVDGLLEPLDIGSFLRGNPNYKTLTSLLGTAGLSLPRNGVFTLFAPTDNAFAGLPRGVAEKLLADPQRLRATLLSHVYNGQLTQFVKGTSFPSLQFGQALDVNVKSCGTYINGARITGTFFPALNGFVFQVDSVITLKDLLTVATGLGHTTFVAAVRASIGVVGNISAPFVPRTVFVPTNAAFQGVPNLATLLLAQNARTLTEVVNYHVVPDEEIYAGKIINTTAITANNRHLLTLSTNVSGVFVNGLARVVTADLITSNAIGHVVNVVLLPRTISQILADNSVFNFASTFNLYKLINFTAINSTRFTVFAPTESAFNALTAAQLANIQRTPALALQIISYHVVPFASCSVQWTNGLQLPTLLGSNNVLNVTLTNGQRYKVNDANVVLVDHVATNGVVHVIDKILLPPGVTV
eukprot:TRINITY_DN452_c0_g1_i5.p1 TRINITY_DN452_c0_g1~~TRINITY_DN452_c0_g1_i5.p1  ORF type:complete len:618 (+),score=226.80 TRINITY_DN452_c0_g1_i5:208-1854(+)